MKKIYDIRRCRLEELSDLQAFIHRYWKADHVLSLDSRLLRWQHKDRSEKKLNFVVAINRIRGTIDAVLGYIPCSHFSNNLEKNSDIWLAIWKINDLIPEAKGIGIELLFYLYRKKPISIGAIGINDEIRKFYRASRYETGVMSHYFISNPAVKTYRIMKGIDTSSADEAKTAGTSLSLAYSESMPLYNFDDDKIYPRKNHDYFQNRYGSHPKYQYKFLSLLENEKPITTFVVRTVCANDAKCLRVVDVAGRFPLKMNVRQLFLDHLIAASYEYMDFLNFGYSKPDICAMGFNLLDPDGDLIIPNYFEPFVQKNIPIQFAYRCSAGQYVIVKGDSDQDRPNL